MITEKEFLNDNWWLVVARYPVACDASIIEVIKSDEDPTLDSMYADELVEECVDSFSYLDEFCYDEELDNLEGYSEEEQYTDWYEQQKEDIQLTSERINKNIIDEYGLELLNNYASIQVNNNNYCICNINSN